MPILETIDGAKINYEKWPVDESDTGPFVTLINGHTRSLTDYRQLGKLLNSFGYNVIALDNRGSGKTEITAGMAFSVSDMVRDVVGIWDQEGVAESHLMGISMGGLIAQALACQHSDRIMRLILVSTSPSRSYLKNNEQGWVTDAEGIEAKMAGYFAPGFISRNRLLFDAMVKQTFKAMADGSFLVRAELQRKAIQGFTPPPVEQIRAATLVIHGEEDAIVDLEGGRELARRIPGARLMTLPKAGHLLLAEKPKELFDAVTGFLGS